ncbi:MAG: hypothetical protein NTW21_12460 [Verrucomicrobia bacterium]|nr:hypothetical protein [Verrucomicrobiota bacterium]
MGDFVRIMVKISSDAKIPILSALSRISFRESQDCAWWGGGTLIRVVAFRVMFSFEGVAGGDSGEMAIRQIEAGAA